MVKNTGDVSFVRALSDDGIYGTIFCYFLFSFTAGL